MSIWWTHVRPEIGTEAVEPVDQLSRGIENTSGRGDDELPNDRSISIG
jgi:hypothetical protein